MTLSFPTLVLMQCSWQPQVCVEFFVAASVADINSSMLLVLWQGHIPERIYQLSHSSISISWVLAVSLLFSNSPNYDTVFRRFSMCFSSKSPQILRKTGHDNGPICVLALCQSLPTLALGFVWWLPLAGRSAVIVTLTRMSSVPGFALSCWLRGPSKNKSKWPTWEAPSHNLPTTRAANNSILHRFWICRLTTKEL